MNKGVRLVVKIVKIILYFYSHFFFFVAVLVVLELAWVGAFTQGVWVPS